MPRGSGDNIVPIGVQVEGAQEADRALEVLANRIEKMNGGGAPAPGGSSAFGSLTPPGAPKPGTGLEGYANGASYSTGGTYAPPGMGSGVMSGGGVYSPSNPLSPGALAPNPLTGNAVGGTMNGSGGGGNQTIMANNVTVVGGGSANPSATPSGGSGAGSGGYGSGGSGPMSPGAAPGSGAPSPPGSGSGGSGSHPLPGGWNPFQPNQNPQPGFVEQLYSHLDQMNPLKNAMASKFLSGNPFGRQMLGGLASFEGMMPAGMAGGLAGGLAMAAPFLGVAAAGVGAWDFFAQGQMPRYNLETSLMASRQSGQYRDPLMVAAETRAADIQGGINKWESFRGNPIGWALRIASLGAADVYWNNYQRPAYEREKELALAGGQGDIVDREMRRITGGRLPRDGQQQNRVGLLSGMGAFAGKQGDFATGVDYRDYAGFASPEAVNSGYGAIFGTVQSQGYEGYARRFLGGEGPDNFFGVTRSDAIFRGDTNRLNAMLPQYMKQYGVDKGRDMMRADAGRAIDMGESRTAGAIASSNLSISRSSVQMAQLSGASGYAVAEQTGALAAGYAPILSSLQTQLAAAPNELERSRIREQIAQVKVAAQSERRSAEMMRFSTRQTEVGTQSSLAGTFLQRAMYGDSEEAVIGGFGRQASASREQVSLLRKMAKSPYISLEERRQYSAQAEAVQNQIDYEIPRQMGGYRLGLRQGEIGVAGAREGVIAQNAGLYGGIGDVYRASLGQTDIIRQQLGVVGRELGGEFGPRTQQERLDLQKQQIDLQRQLNAELEQAKRSYASANLSVAQFTQGMVGAGANYKQTFFGVGGAEAGREHGEVVGAARQTLSVAQKNFDAVRGLPADNPYRQQRERELMDARMGAQNAVQDYARLPVSVDLQREQMAGQFRLSAISRTYMPFGDIRGTVAGLMRNVGAQGKEIGAQQRAGLAAIDSDTSLTAQERAERKSVLLRDFEARRYGLGNELLGYQSQLETGWQDRLISSVVGMPGRGTFVASQFTRKEAAPFLQNLSSVFGFSGRDAESHRDNYMFRGPRLASSVQGVIQRPDGFMETAVAFGASGGHGQVLRPSVGGGGTGSRVSRAARELAEALEEEARRGSGSGSNPIGMGKSSNPFHNITNNWDLLRPHYANGTSHQ